jgi:hypothetical protein
MCSDQMYERNVVVNERVICDRNKYVGVSRLKGDFIKIRTASVLPEKRPGYIQRKSINSLTAKSYMGADISDTRYSIRFAEPNKGCSRYL